MKKIATYMALGLLLTTGTQAVADESSHSNQYEITVTNLSRGQSFTPILVATHKAGVSLFTEGAPANPELALLAEGGNTVPLAAMLGANPNVFATTTIPGLLAPGKSVTVKVMMADGFENVSMAAMLIPTNDGFFALNGVLGPKGKKMSSFESPAYDAGSEPNDEMCASIPGPVCGGEGASPNDGGEGFVHIHAGIHGIGNLPAADRDWRNPVARVAIKRVP
jgi:hypothetical protein